MKVIVNVKKEVDIKTIIVKAGVRYWEDTEINGEADTEDGQNIPCKNGDTWELKIDIETGQILNWKQGVEADVHYKVCDQCSWELKDENGETVLSKEDDYVPKTLCPKEAGYGDYIIMDINENGMIADWKFDIENFQHQD